MELQAQRSTTLNIKNLKFEVRGSRGRSWSQLQSVVNTGTVRYDYLLREGPKELSCISQQLNGSVTGFELKNVSPY